MPYTLHPDDWEPQGVDSVEPNAWDVIQSTEHTSVVAGPGSGKTELLAQRASYILQTGLCPPPRRILAISFKVDAARNLEERVAERCDPGQARRFDSLTFDAFNMKTLVRCRKAVPEWCRPSPDFEPYVRGWRQDLKVHLEDPPGVEEGSLTQRRLRQIDANRFYNDFVLAPIPTSGFPKDTIRKMVASSWWQALLGGHQSRLTFSMISRLTEFLLRQCPDLNNALRSTYSHVFLDEFQDVTSWQYDFLQTAFRDADTVLTAVGDRKQSIMGWAGAIPKPFQNFESDFSAKTQPLISNYRSTPELVNFQHSLAQLLDPQSQKAESKQERQVAGDVCQVWTFPNTTSEAERIAEYIDTKRQNQDLDSGDFAIIVKQYAGDFTESLKSSFEERNLKIRNESKLQRVLSQDLTDLFLSFLRLGSSGTPGAYWTRCCNFMEHIESRGMGEDPEESRRIREQLAEFHDWLLQAMSPGPPNREGELRDILQRVLDFVGKSRIQGSYPAYRRERDFEHWYEKLVSQLFPVLQDHDDWVDALDEFEGVDVTPVMTIHKSKGLEYHTVFFIAFEDDTWWTMHSSRSESQIEESLRAFFVGFSRAEQRVIFTNCSARSECQEVAWLYETLRQAGANFQQF